MAVGGVGGTDYSQFENNNPVPTGKAAFVDVVSSEIKTVNPNEFSPSWQMDKNRTIACMDAILTATYNWAKSGGNPPQKFTEFVNAIHYMMNEYASHSYDGSFQDPSADPAQAWMQDADAKKKLETFSKFAGYSVHMQAWVYNPSSGDTQYGLLDFSSVSKPNETDNWATPGVVKLPISSSLLAEIESQCLACIKE